MQHVLRAPELVAWLRRILANQLTDSLRRYGLAARDGGEAVNIDY